MDAPDSDYREWNRALHRDLEPNFEILCNSFSITWPLWHKMTQKTWTCGYLCDGHLKYSPFLPDHIQEFGHISTDENDVESHDQGLPFHSVFYIWIQNLHALCASQRTIVKIWPYINLSRTTHETCGHITVKLRFSYAFRSDVTSILVITYMGACLRIPGVA